MLFYPPLESRNISSIKYLSMDSLWSRVLHILLASMWITGHKHIVTLIKLHTPYTYIKISY